MASSASQSHLTGAFPVLGTPTNAVDFIRTFLDITATSVRANGTMFRTGRPIDRANDNDTSFEEVGEDVLRDEAVEFCRRNRLPFTGSDVARGIRLAVGVKKMERRDQLLSGLFAELPEGEKIRANGEFRKFASLFAGPEALVIAGLRHLIWQVKRKASRRKVSHHLMLVIVNEVQSAGKTEFVRKLKEPLEELASDPFIFSDIADKRMGDVYEYLLVDVDDMGRIPPDSIPTLKSIVTSPWIMRRILGTSRSRRIRQDATFIGTSNRPIWELLTDETGYRRFLMLRFRNGNVAKGGAPDVWPTVNAIDFRLLLRAVSARDERGPIKDHLDALYAQQDLYAPVDPLREWLRAFDRNAERVRNITGPKGIGADKLRQLYLDETGNDLSTVAFAREMRRHFSDPMTPFGRQDRLRDGVIYFWKSARHSLPTAAAPLSMIVDPDMHLRKTPQEAV